MVVRPRSSEQLLGDESDFAGALRGAREALSHGQLQSAVTQLSAARQVVGYERSGDLSAIGQAIPAIGARGGLFQKLGELGIRGGRAVPLRRQQQSGRGEQ